eukprot:GFUD01089942.1.p1 GENE.GFUD01089942.1~~GFUD01089942.1.p1  ORF type:complete len:138 (+),score=47.40 GFUD01089942.1:37-414(+)
MEALKLEIPEIDFTKGQDEYEDLELFSAADIRQFSAEQERSLASIFKKSGLKELAKKNQEGGAKAPRKCGLCSQSGHYRNRCPMLDQPQNGNSAGLKQTKPKQQRKCSNCKKPGHSLRDCSALII